MSVLPARQSPLVARYYLQVESVRWGGRFLKQGDIDVLVGCKQAPRLILPGDVP